MNQQEMKILTGKGAVDALVSRGMKLGLGTGSTALQAVNHIGRLIQEGKLTDIRAVPTSLQTLIACEEWGIPVYTLNSKEILGRLDLTIDGADEIDGDHYCVKGGGGALLPEKITAYASAAYAIVADETKLVKHLGQAFPVPVEIIPEARIPVMQAVERLGGVPRLREAVRKAGPVVTDHGNLLLDVRFLKPVDPVEMEQELNRIPGVVENGFFTKLRPMIFIAHGDGVLEMRK
ncbi:MAG: ribose-5-phosphate isomerase RpiA [Spirochaetaceae bacterium]|jgi:ribose 5-phosphate isomerase A|nr:ribose-5-phosphate isomerase RpiA [Spirochaetaceae bacterium]